MCLHLSLALLPRMQGGLCLSQSPLCVHCLQFHACTWAPLRLFQTWLLWSLTFSYSPCLWHLSHAVGILIFCQQPTSFLLTALGPLPVLCLPPTSCLAASWFGSLVTCLSLHLLPHTQPLTLVPVTRKNGRHQEEGLTSQPWIHKAGSVCCHLFVFLFAKMTPTATVH